MNSSSQSFIETIRQRPVKGDSGFGFFFAIVLLPCRPSGGGLLLGEVAPVEPIVLTVTTVVTPFRPASALAPCRLRPVPVSPCGPSPLLMRHGPRGTCRRRPAR